MLPAAFEKRKRGGRREYLRARLDGDGRVEVFASEGRGAFPALSGLADWLNWRTGRAPFVPGDPVRYLPFTEFGL